MSPPSSNNGGPETRRILAEGDPPDQPARDRIASELDANLMVEAGAGSGKTTALVGRMTALIKSGVRAEHIAAVTFTRKAAAELGQRFQEALEEVVAEAAPGSSDRKAAVRALRDLDQAFVGTIHSFCARLLRQRPLAAGLDPDFTEVQESESARMEEQAWADFLERLAKDGDRRLARLERLGIPPARLREAFRHMVEHPDVDFSVPGAGGPPSSESAAAGAAGASLEEWFENGGRPLPAEAEEVRSGLDALLARAEELLPASEPAKGWDSLARKVRTLLASRRMFDWDKPTDFFEALWILHGRKLNPTQNRWSDTAQGKAAAKELGEDMTAFAAAEGAAARLLEKWWAHRYPAALEVAQAAAKEFEESRRREGKLTFPDLLLLTTRMLRERPKARQELGRRYQRILVDEFQDTDPLQAELLFLLASEPGEQAPAGAWRRAVPRDGALFVVGDPKQSIYRFRRADISLYQFVKKRFRTFGHVLKLEANFRSVDKIGVLSDGVFAGENGFPKEDTDQQAAFAALGTRRHDHPGRLALYEVAEGPAAQKAADDAARIATEIERRVSAGDRKPEDFMVLTGKRKHLDIYARALEDRNIPVDVSGGGASSSDELLAFLLLFKCLADPSNAVLVLGVLAGPLFGVKLDQIVRFRQAKGRLAINVPPDLADGSGEHAGAEGTAESGEAAGAGDPPAPAHDPAEHEKAQAALRTLHGWWKQAREEPADIVAERLVRKTGLFPVSAAGPLGQLQAGTLAYVLDAVRVAALGGDASLTGAVRAMESALGWREAEPLLVPGMKAVRVMNLHRAKGLEANVVFLAAPFGEAEHVPTMHVARGGDGATARGTLEIAEPRLGWSPPKVIARPLGWEKDRDAEASFQAAEKVRLLYVAATRARDELWVAKVAKKEGKRSSKAKSKSPWAVIEQWMEMAAKAKGDGRGSGDGGPVVQVVELPVGEAREPLQLDPETDLVPTVKRIERRRDQAGVPSYRGESVSEVAKRVAGQESAPSSRTPSGAGNASALSSWAPPAAGKASSLLDFDPPALGPGPGGREWGEIAHAVLEAAAEGTKGAALAAVAKRHLAAKRRKLDSSGEPAELPVLMSLVEAVTASSLWGRAMASPERYAEVKFAFHEDAPPGGVPSVVTGAIDLVFRDLGTGGWVVVDYKTDGGQDSEFPKRVLRYRAQVDLYAKSWEALVGEPVHERVLLFAAQGKAESW